MNASLQAQKAGHVGHLVVVVVVVVGVGADVGTAEGLARGRMALDLL